MTFYFIGGEDHDFSKIGVASVDTATTAARRTANARCSLKVGPSAASTDGWQGAFGTALTSFWITARLYVTSSMAGSATFNLISLLDGTTRRLSIGNDASARLQIKKTTGAGTTTTLATSSNVFAINAQYKIDLQVISYGAAATVNAYVDNVLWLTYSGDVTTDGASSLSGFVLGGFAGGTQTASWSEIIVSSDDTRSLSLVTLPPAANGNAFAWSNTYASVNEVTTDDASLCASSVAGDLLETTITSTGISGTPAVLALCVSSRAQKGGTGPQNIALAVRTGGNDYFAANQALPAAFNRVATIFETNPATSGAWAYTDLKAAGFNIGAKSVA